MAYPECLSQFVQGDHCWVTLPALQAAEVLLAKAGLLGKRLLRHSLTLTN